MSDTKDRILSVSLELFSKNGYEGTSVSDIAAELGITKGALYKHYENKQAIFDSICDMMDKYDKENASFYRMPKTSVANAPESYRITAMSNVISLSKAMFRYWTEDDFPAKFRKMLTIEQFRNEDIGKLYAKYLTSGPLNYLKEVFSAMGFRAPESMAIEFYSPMFYLYSEFDNSADKEAVKRTLAGTFDNFMKKVRARVY